MTLVVVCGVCGWTSIGVESESATYAELYSGDWEHPSFSVT